MAGAAPDADNVGAIEDLSAIEESGSIGDSYTDEESLDQASKKRKIGPAAGSVGSDPTVAQNVEFWCENPHCRDYLKDFKFASRKMKHYRQVLTKWIT